MFPKNSSVCVRACVREEGAAPAKRNHVASGGASATDQAAGAVVFGLRYETAVSTSLREDAGERDPVDSVNSVESAGRVRE